ncbi:hypothetical protein MFU01_63440 [Myxococcus fulvus]|uniref:Uncharacterized protein n=1 Tax=Myxococcus fulvus TaxID=33 RepID=A0A511TB25_MYXFU|nr:hypothetical protein MFU01_63440 [Myxococcus fulvus]
MHRERLASGSLAVLPSDSLTMGWIPAIALPFGNLEVPDSAMLTAPRRARGARITAVTRVDAVLDEGMELAWTWAR